MEGQASQYLQQLACCGGCDFGILTCPFHGSTGSAAGLKGKIPFNKTWRLNERHYGGLTGLNKAETADKYGEDQVKIWRRSYDVPPLAMDKDHAYYKTIQEDARYSDIPEGELPNCESLKLTIERSLPYWNESIAPKLKEGKNLIIAAHGNSLRGIVKHLEGLT